MKRGTPYLEYNFYFHYDTNENNYNKMIDEIAKIDLQKYQIAYLPISFDAKNKDDNTPITIKTDGSIFSMDNFDNKTYQKGLATYKLFKKLVEILEPSYASITLDYDLKTPYDIVVNENKATLAFQDFYLGINYFESLVLQKFISELKQLDIYVEDFKGGFYYSLSSLFNPKKKETTFQDRHVVNAQILRLFRSKQKLY